MRLQSSRLAACGCRRQRRCSRGIRRTCRRPRRRHPGQRPADADRAAGFLSARRADDRDVARNVTSIITANLQRSGLFAPIDPAAYIEKIANIDAVPRFPDWRAINAQALVTGRITRQADGRLQGRIPAVGRVRRPAAHRPAIFHHAGQLAPHRAHHLRRDLRAPHRREGLFRQPRRVRRRDRPEGPPRQAARASWTRTAPTCAISRAATTWC